MRAEWVTAFCCRRGGRTAVSYTHLDVYKRQLPVRVHGAFVRDQEVHAVVQDWKARGRPQYVDGITSDLSLIHIFIP